MATKNDIVTTIAEKHGLTKTSANAVVNDVFGFVTDQLREGEEVAISGFGKFEVRERAERKGRNPQTGEELTIAATKTPGFKAGKGLKDAVKG